MLRQNSGGCPEEFVTADSGPERRRPPARVVTLFSSDSGRDLVFRHGMLRLLATRLAARQQVGQHRVYRDVAAIYLPGPVHCDFGHLVQVVVAEVPGDGERGILRIVRDIENSQFHDHAGPKQQAD
jgi:hypothetical protein